jgi:glycosyltransferase involved in cell wall biosynthesis
VRVGILGHGFIDWGGGIDFLRMLISSLHHGGEPMEFHVLVPTAGPRLRALRVLQSGRRRAKAFLRRSNHVSATPAPKHLAELAEAADQPIRVHDIDIGNAAILRKARELSLDVLIPVMSPLPSNFPIPWVGYIYDFQHRYFPNLFTSADRARRDLQFSSMLGSARAVIVNARAVADDIARFHPNSSATVFALPFSASPQQGWIAATVAPTEKYGIRGRYFIICNQFWQHKDHATAFDAYVQFAATHPDVDLVCTGSTEDYRSPDYFPSLKRKLSDDGVADRVHILGMVPKSDQIALLKEAVALIQPTLFEGGPGGGAVYDAVALGVPCLVSDTPVNRELTDPEVSFFPAGDVGELARAMHGSIERSIDILSSELLVVRGKKRREACGRQLIAAIQCARLPPTRLDR